MSIINDALKKASQPVIGTSEKRKPDSKPASSAKEPTPIQTEIKSYARSSSRTSWAPFLVLALLFLVAAPVLAPILYHPEKDASSSPASSLLQGSSASGQFAIEEAPRAEAVVQKAGLFGGSSILKQKPFVLSGVVYSEAGSYCLINGKVLKSGESIGGAVIEKITQTEVILNSNGEKIILQASQG